MNRIFLLISFSFMVPTLICAQETISSDRITQEIQSLIDQYLKAREKKDTVLLQSILAAEIDQLVSSGEWRIGINECLDGMIRSSINNPGERKIEIEKIRFLNSQTGIADARYEITNPDNSVRKMWSTFIVVYKEKKWKITAIRNMRYL